MFTKNRGIVSLTILSCITFIGAPVQSAQPERPINSVRVTVSESEFSHRRIAKIAKPTGSKL
jgi:hypothetical protein